MRSRSRIFLAAVVAALCVATLILMAGSSRRAQLSDTGETRRAVEQAATRLLPAAASSAADAALRAAAQQLSRERYVARLWLVDPSGRILVSRNAPGREGENVNELAPPGFIETLRGVAGAGLGDSQLTQLAAAAAVRRDGDHNDVFKPLVRAVRTPQGADAALVVLCYDVNPAVAGGFFPLDLAAIVCLALYWGGLAAWVFVDARARRENSALWCLLVLFTNLVGALAYLLATSRPPAVEATNFAKSVRT